MPLRFLVPNEVSALNLLREQDTLLRTISCESGGQDQCNKLMRERFKKVEKITVLRLGNTQERQVEKSYQLSFGILLSTQYRHEVCAILSLH